MFDGFYEFLIFYKIISARYFFFILDYFHQYLNFNLFIGKIKCIQITRVMTV